MSCHVNFVKLKHPILVVLYADTHKDLFWMVPAGVAAVGLQLRRSVRNKSTKKKRMTFTSHVSCAELLRACGSVWSVDTLDAADTSMHMHTTITRKQTIRTLLR